MGWQNAVARRLYAVKKRAALAKFRFKQRFDLVDPVQILPYRGYGTAQGLHLKGRVLEDKGVTTLEDLKDNHSAWDNLRDMYRRLESDEIPQARLLARFRDTEQTLQTDAEGYFNLELELARPLEMGRVWQEISLTLLAPRVEGQGRVQTTGYVLAPPPEAEFGVITDIDDTVVKTSAANLFKMIRIVFFANARSRLPFKGIAAFYQALQHGRSGGPYNPIFYVSSSPWNLYDLLIDFFTWNEIPVGPLFLRDYGLSAGELLPLDHKKHKLRWIETILAAYPRLPFILIGDSGQDDPVIYRQVVNRHPNRILAIYIRDVASKRNEPQLLALVESLRQVQVEMMLAPDTFVAAHHAAEKGFISKAALPAILAEKERDEGEPGPLERLL